MSAERKEMKRTTGKVVKFTGSGELLKQSGAEADSKADDVIKPAEVTCENGVCSVTWKPNRPAA